MEISLTAHKVHKSQSERFLDRLCAALPPHSRFAALQVMLAHCGSLYLDPWVLSEVYHELCLLERLFRKPHR